jgi:hypothetical protein
MGNPAVKQSEVRRFAKFAGIRANQSLSDGGSSNFSGRWIIAVSTDAFHNHSRGEKSHNDARSHGKAPAAIFETPSGVPTNLCQGACTTLLACLGADVVGIDNDDSVTKDNAIELLANNRAAAASATRALDDEEPDRTAPARLYGDAPVTYEFMLEDHAALHRYPQLARTKAALVR